MIARTTLGRALSALLSLCLSQIAVPAAQAAEPDAPAVVATHLATSDQVHSRLAAAAATRDAQVRAVQDLLETPDARRQAGLLGVDAGRLRAAVPHLSRAELADLSTRATQVKEVVAGHSTSDSGLIILGVVLLVAGLVVLVATSDYGYYDDCGCYY